MDTRSPSEPEDVGPRAIAKVGFIGLGEMGGAMARRIIDAGWPTVLWARRPEVLDAFRGPDVEASPTPAALAAAADLIGICVWSDADVREVMAGDDGVLAGCRPGTVVAVHSTVSPATCRELSELASAREVVLLDCPVSGGRDVALEGALTVAIGGDPAAAARCRPVFESFAGTLVELGGVGAAQVAKLLNNALLAANLTVADDALALGESLGLDVDQLATFLSGGSGRSLGLDVCARARSSAEMRDAALPALEKDVASLADEAAGVSRADSLLSNAATEAIRRLRHPPAGWHS